MDGANHNHNPKEEVTMQALPSPTIRTLFCCAVSIFLLPLQILAMNDFPVKGTDIINHELRVEVDVGDNGTVDDTLVFNGWLTIDRSDPFTNDQGFRQIDFTVTNWVASAWSNVFQDSVRYVIAQDTVQPPSKIVAEQAGSDYPATLIIKVIFNAFLGNTLVFRHHVGMPMGSHFLVIPPDSNRINSPTITGFETAQILVTHPTLGLIRFKPKDCNDKKSTTIGTRIPTLTTWGVVALVLLLILTMIVLRWKKQRLSIKPS